MSNKELRKLLRSREKDAADQLMVDHSLREHLNDEQANRVLEWGFDRLAQTVETTAEMSDTAATPTINKAVASVKAIMMQVDELVNTFAKVEDDTDAQKLYVKFLNELKSITDVPKEMFDASESVAQARAKLGPEGIYQRLITILEET